MRALATLAGTRRARGVGLASNSDPHLIELRGIRDGMPADPQSKTSHRAALQGDEDMRRDEPWLWHFANVVTWTVHPWVSLRRWWMGRSM
jgi:hypothetical protein